jgi:SAM-dependent methyltransferase
VGKRQLSSFQNERHQFGDSSVGSSGRKMAGNSFIGKIARRFSFWHYFHFIDKYATAGARGLEFGSGGGNRWLAKTYDMVSLEYGFFSSKAATEVYASCVNGDASCTPFADRSFDFVCSCFVLEHFPYPVAQMALSEMLRILRPGGKFIALMDLHCNRPFLRRLRERYPRIYQEAMVDFPGHHGLLPATQWRSSVEAAGFAVKVWRLQSRFPISDLGTYVCLAAAPSAPPHLRLLGKGALWLAQRAPWGSLYQISLTALDDLIGWTFPRNWAYRLLFVLEKP